MMEQDPKPVRLSLDTGLLESTPISKEQGRLTQVAGTQSLVDRQWAAYSVSSNTRLIHRSYCILFFFFFFKFIRDLVQ